MMFKLIFFFGFICTSYGWIDMTSNLKGRIVHIESLRWKGFWMNTGAKLLLNLASSDERDVYYKDWTQVQVMDCDKAYACLEAVKYRLYYLSFGKKDWLPFFEKSTYSRDKPEFKWKIECKTEKMSECRLFNNHTRRYLSVRNDKIVGSNIFVTSSSYNNLADFRVLAPKPQDYFNTVLVTENQSTFPLKKQIKLFEGVTKKTTDIALATFMMDEVSAAFVSLAKFSSGRALLGLWLRVSSKTFEKSTEITYDLTIPPKTKFTFQQLRGEYAGEFLVDVAQYRVLSENLEENNNISK